MYEVTLPFLNTLEDPTPSVQNEMRLPCFNFKKMVGVYCAIHRQTGMCYVGSSSSCIHKRYRSHLQKADRGSLIAFHRAIREHGPAAFDFEILRECKAEECVRWEEFYIQFLNSASAEGLNTVRKPTKTRTGFTVEAATRNRISIATKGIPKSPSALVRMHAASKGKPRSEETKRKISDAHRGKTMSEEARRNMSKARQGRTFAPHSEETRRKMSEAHMGKVVSAETRKRISEVQSGKVILEDVMARRLKYYKTHPVSQETREKISAAGKGRIFSAEHRALISASQKGKVMSAESRAKMSASKRGIPLSEETKALRAATRERKRQETLTTQIK